MVGGFVSHFHVLSIFVFMDMGVQFLELLEHFSLRFYFIGCVWHKVSS